MRVLVASDGIGALTSAQAGAALASGWAGADVRVLSVGDSGHGFLTAYADLLGAEVEIAVEDGYAVTSARADGDVVLQVSAPDGGDGLPLTASSRPLGAALARVLAGPRPDRVLLDLSGLRVHDGGAGMLAGLGVRADQPLDQGVQPLATVTEVDLAAAHAALGDTELIGVVPADQLGQHLLGLRGITSLRGREAGLDPADLLATDAALDRFARLAAADQATAAGAGACGGLGFAVLALGGRLTTGPALAFESTAGVRARHRVELVVTGCSVFDFLRRGGGVVAAAAQLASDALSPCVLIAGEVVVGAREMRTMGIEAAYAVRESSLDVPQGAVTAEELSAYGRSGGPILELVISVCERGSRAAGLRRNETTTLYRRRATTKPVAQRDQRADQNNTHVGHCPMHLLDCAQIDSAIKLLEIDMTATDQTFVTAPAVADGVLLTDGAAGKVKALLEGEGRDDLALRVAVQPGGCSGLRYQLFFDERNLEGDVVKDFGGVHVVTDRMSAPYLMGATIDFVDTIEKQGFTIDNPNATGSCACGDSFH